MVGYYSQRVSEGGLPIPESAHPSYDSRGYVGAPGVYQIIAPFPGADGEKSA
jgi:N-ethylmaleimide reductase